MAGIQRRSFKKLFFKDPTKVPDGGNAFYKTQTTALYQPETINTAHQTNHHSVYNLNNTVYSSREYAKTTVASVAPFSSTSNRKDIREQTIDGGTICYNPDPSKYAQTENMIGSNFVSNIKPNMYEVVTRTQGKLIKTIQPMHADKSVRCRFEIQNQLETPCFTHYAPPVVPQSFQVKRPESAAVMQQIRKQIKWHKQLKTTPSIPIQSKEFSQLEQQFSIVQSKTNLNYLTQSFKQDETSVYQVDQKFNFDLEMKPDGENIVPNIDINKVINLKTSERELPISSPGVTELPKPKKKTTTEELIKSCAFIKKSQVLSVGPAHYRPKIEITHQRVKAAKWQLNRRNSIQPKSMPGPGHYNQQGLSISAIQLQNILTTQDQQQKTYTLDDDIKQRLQNVHRDEHKAKLGVHLQSKLSEKQNRAPGYSQRPQTTTTLFKKSNFKGDQFFGTTADRGQTTLQAETAKHPDIGPGVYDNPEPLNRHKHNNTATFLNARNENIFNVIEGIPGPQHYNNSNSKTNSFDINSIQAFGKTEKRFARINYDNNDSRQPGPGSYSKPSIRNHRKNKSHSATFRSNTGRMLDHKYQSASVPVGVYEVSKQIGSIQLQGGAPNNFLLTKHCKLSAPFGSTVSKGWLNAQKESAITPQQPTSESFQEMRQKQQYRNQNNVMSKSDRFK